MFVSYSICFRLCLDNKISEIFPFFFVCLGMATEYSIVEHKN